MSPHAGQRGDKLPGGTGIRLRIGLFPTFRNICFFSFGHSLGRLLTTHVLLGLSLAFRHPIDGLALLLISLVLLVLSVRDGFKGGSPADLPPWFLMFLLAFEAGGAFLRAPGLRQLDPSLLVFWSILLIMLAVVWAGNFRPAWAGKGAAASLLILYIGMGAYLIHRHPTPPIDVFLLQQQGAHDLFLGRNPYELTYPNIYNAKETLEYYGDDRRLLSTYGYPPVSLLATAPGYWLGGDVRFSMLAAQALIGLLLWKISSRRGQSASFALSLLALHLFHPMGIHILQHAWTEPLVGAMTALMFWTRIRPESRLNGMALGMFFGVKQYVIVSLPLFLFKKFAPENRVRLWTQAILFGGSVTLPFLLWNPGEFLGDLAGTLMSIPPRRDSLAVPAAVFKFTGWWMPGYCSYIAAAAGVVWAWRRLPSGPGGLALGMALIYFLTFLFGKQAFPNYYYYVNILLLISAALAPSRRQTHP